MKRKKIVAGNWKMNLDSHTAVALAKDLQATEGNLPCEVIVCPSFVFISDIQRILSSGSIKIGAQNCADKENGAFTGEVSVTQLKSLGVEYVIIGHSERREHYRESNEQLLHKLKMVLKHGLKPIFCCGEPRWAREEEAQDDYVKKQLEESLFPLSSDEMANVIVAYEPIWAIGTGLNATTEQAQQMHHFIRKQLETKYDVTVASQIPILYGGSCKPDNAKELFNCEDVDGGLIGGASLKANDFLAIINAAK